jgi:uncharacterized protein
LAVNVYADASLIVALIVPDIFNERARRYIDSERPTLLVSDFAAAEFSSVLRTRELTAAQARTAFAEFDAWSALRGRRLELTGADVALAETFLRRLDLTLRTPDALNIAIAQRHECTLATFDVGMADAARALGLGIAPT